MWPANKSQNDSSRTTTSEWLTTVSLFPFENGELAQLCLRYKHVCPVTSTAQPLPHHHDPCVLSWHKASISCSLIHKRPPQRTDLCVWFGRFWSQLFFLILPVSPPGPRVSSQCGVAVPNNHCATWTISWIHSYVYTSVYVYRCHDEW